MDDSAKQSVKMSYVFNKFKLILNPEASFYIVSTIYGVAVSLLSLAIPISVQALVNTVSFGVLKQPLLVITILLLSLLGISGVLRALQTFTLEIFQRHFYARISSEIAIRLVNSDFKFLQKINAAKLANRYFDVMTVQKGFSVLIVDGVAVLLQTFVGLMILAFYHPYFLIFDLILIFSLCMVWVLFGKEALFTSSKESKAKYRTADWLEELARINLFFKKRTTKEAALAKADQRIQNYIEHRKKHFKNLFSQTIILLVLYALLSALVLGLGGFLVIEGQLSIGQLVAAELIITAILTSLSKFGKYLETFYDVFAAVEKLSIFYEIPAEKAKNKILPLDDESKSFDLSFEDVTLEDHDRIYKFNLTFERSKKYLLKNCSLSSKLHFFDLLQNLRFPKTGNIKLGDLNFNNISQLDIRDKIFIFDVPEVFEGTLKENLSFSTTLAEDNELNQALKEADLYNLEHIFNVDNDSLLLSSGYPLWHSQLVRLEVAKAILQKPKILVLTETFDFISDQRREAILNHFLKQDMTLIYFSNKPILENKFDHIHSFSNSDWIINE